MVLSRRRSLYMLLGYSLVNALLFGAVSLLICVSYPVEILIFRANLIAGAVGHTSLSQDWEPEVRKTERIFGWVVIRMPKVRNPSGF